MCFSLAASVSAGAVLAAAGAVTLSLARRRAELPLASVPLLFGVQQLIEGVVWWSLDHDDARLDAVASAGYMVFSHVLWPVFVPFTMWCLEVVPRRRRVMLRALAVGLVVSLHGTVVVLDGRTVGHVVGSSIQYAEPGPLVVVLYLLATCVGTMASSHRFLQLVGAAALALALVTLWLYAAVFVSVWCFFSTVLTSFILVWFWSRRPSPAAARR